MAQLASKSGENNSIKSGDGDRVSYEVFSKPNSQVEILITVKPDRFTEARETVYNKLAKETKVKGFRPGKAPRKLVEAKLGARLFEDAISHLIPRVTSETIEKLDYRPLDYAEYKVQELKDDFTLVYSATFTIFPEVVIPDFKKLKVKKDEVKVESKEVDELFEKLKKEVTESIENRNKKQAEKDEKGEQGKDSDKKDVKKKDEKIEIDWAAELGQEDMKTEADVKKMIKKNITARRDSEAEEDFMAEIIEKAIELTKIEAPKSLVDEQAKRKEDAYKHRIENLGLKLEDFLKTQKTSLEDLRESWKEEAEFQIASDILFMSLADKYDIKITGEEIDKQIDAIQDKNLKAEYETDRGRSNIATILMRQRSVEKLQELMGIKKPDKKDDSKKESKKTTDKKEDKEKSSKK